MLEGLDDPCGLEAGADTQLPHYLDGVSVKDVEAGVVIWDAHCAEETDGRPLAGQLPGNRTYRAFGGDCVLASRSWHVGLDQETRHLRSFPAGRALGRIMAGSSERAVAGRWGDVDPAWCSCWEELHGDGHRVRGSFVAQQVDVTVAGVDEPLSSRVDVRRA